jgi:regulatory protein
LPKPRPLASEDQAARYALRLLGRRAYSRGELGEKFRLRGLAADVQARVLSRLEEKGWLNDRAFAENFVLSKRGRNWGPRKIQAALRRKHLSRESADSALNRAFPAGQEPEQARDFLSRQKRRFLAKKNMAPHEIRRKAFEFLVRKGYSMRAARLAVTEVLGYNSGLLGGQEVSE